jgi:hypothetical protein
LFVWDGKEMFFLANKTEIARLAKLLMERIFKGKCVLTEGMQREEDVNVVEYCDMKSETNLKSELKNNIDFNGKTKIRKSTQKISSLKWK